MSEEGHRRTPVDMGAGRLEAFSDAVMAVIITLLAFQLRAPLGHELSDVWGQSPHLLIYVLCFLFIAIYWNNHHHLLRATTRISGGVMWSNMLLLFWLSLVPVIALWLQAEGRWPLPVASFGIVALGAALSYTLLVRTLIRANGRDSAVATAIASDVKGIASLVVYAAAVGLAFVNVWIAYALYAGVAVMWLIPDRRFTR